MRRTKRKTFDVDLSPVEPPQPASAGSEEVSASVLPRKENIFTKIFDFLDPHRVGFPFVKYDITSPFIIAAVAFAVYWLIEGGALKQLFFFLQFLNIGIHEAGHPIFRFVFMGNEFMTYAGGGLMEIIVPVCAYFAFTRRGYEWQSDLCVFWLSYSFVSIGSYAFSTSLPSVTLLNGGPGVISDWEYLHEVFGTLHIDTLVAKGFYAVAGLLFAVALYSFIRHFQTMGNYTYRDN